MRGTVDYVAPSDYSEALPVVPATIFVIEVWRAQHVSGDT